MTSAEGSLGKELEHPPNGAVVVNDVKEDDEDDVPMLSSQALEALKEFLAEQNRELEAADDVEEVALVAEDWRLSQFWYDRRTAETVAAEVAALCQTLPSPRVSCIACPTLYAYLKSKECLEKVAETIRYLSIPGESYLLLLTGEVQKDLAAKLLGLHPCGFRPQHSSKLGNEFRLFTSYDPGARLNGWEKEF
ncbi:UNVERIFIED_CONTAM: EEF1A lysine methyltransferase 1 [Sesamum calycinum]|uniref:EEF1A lysine methyltransferase 1 n=1 Tax=Sesamum calycinum TaxID=2727403 RepID=A0AAW2N3L8_9LAMI